MTNDKKVVEVWEDKFLWEIFHQKKMAPDNFDDFKSMWGDLFKNAFRSALAQAGLEITPGWSSDMNAAPGDEAAGKIMLCNVKNGAIALCWWANNLGWCGSEGWNSVKDTWESVPIDFIPTRYRPIFLPPVEEPNQESNDV